MTRTTLNLDRRVLAALKRLQSRERKSLGDLASELLAAAIAERDRSNSAGRLSWISRPMDARIDVLDKESIFAALDITDGHPHRQ